MDPILDFLREQHPFHRLAPQERERAAAAAETLRYHPGDRILRQGGARSEGLYLLAGGEVLLRRDDEDLQILEAGDCFGYPSLINDAPPSVDVIARDDVVVHRVPPDVFRGLLANAAFAEFFLQSLGQRLRRLTQAGGAPGSELTTAVGALVRRGPVRIPADATVGQAARAMRDAREDAALVASEPMGIVTDHDFQTRVLAENLGPDTPVRSVMSSPVKTLPGDMPVHGALLYMLEERVHHLPVSGDDGILGIVSARDLLRQQTRNPLYLMRRLEDLQDPQVLASYSADAAAMVERLFHGGLRVGEIGRVLSSLNDALVRRLCRLAEEALGPPPCPYAWLVFGSEGRMEQALLTDQDNALAYAEASPEAESYFADFARRVNDDLVTAGFPPCPGGCMAVNWNRSVAAWDGIIADWIREPTPDNLMVSSIFFDFRAVAGDLDVTPLADRVASAAENDLFLAHLARVSLRFKPPLGLFQRIRTEDG
ncbi:MAG TPA: DUF294 nucleotidyltransferase-like domain-containing protein, partial [Candidatus Krumholzibacteria bacterium]|nr:DUF294 nucleotidyltransferase-like domain-containing protein [Candidatus Krumholzibacteria bacterium]